MNKYFEAITKKNKTLINKILKDLNHILDINEEVFNGNISEHDIAKHVSNYMEKSKKNGNIKYSCGVKEVIFRAELDSNISDYQLKTLVFAKDFNKNTSKEFYKVISVSIGKKFPEEKLLVEKTFLNDSVSVIFEDDDLNISSYLTLCDSGETEFFINENEKKTNKSNLSDYVDSIIKNYQSEEGVKDLKKDINNYLTMLEDIYSLGDEIKDKVDNLLFEGKPFSEEDKDFLKIIHDISFDENNNNMEKYFSDVKDIKLLMPKPPEYVFSKTIFKYF